MGIDAEGDAPQFRHVSAPFARYGRSMPVLPDERADSPALARSCNLLPKPDKSPAITPKPQNPFFKSIKFKLF